MKLPLSFAPVFLTALAGCTSLGAYGGVMAQPGAAGTPASGTAAAAPESAPAPAATPESAPSPSAPSVVSVSIRNSCGKTVKVFYGTKPKFGSGTYSTTGSNSVQSHSFRPGDLFWIVDQSENGVASVEVTAATREIEIRGSCTELAQR